jgi:ATP-dependent protease ClpP protease subunit
MKTRSHWKNKDSDEDDSSVSTNTSTSEDDEFRVVGNNIFFYSEVTIASVLKLNTTVSKMETDLLKKGIEFGGDPEINLYVHTQGGDAYAGLSAMDHIKNCSVRVNTIVDGHVASAGTFIILGGHYRYMKRHSLLLIHQMNIEGFWGKYDELKDELHNSSKMMNIIIGIYKEYTTVTEKMLKKFMKKDIYISSEDCLKYSIVDEVY